MNIYIRSQDSDLFKYLSDAQYAQIFSQTESIELKPAEVILEKGSLPDSFIILQEGELELTGKQYLGSLFPGEYYGEIFYLESFPSPLEIKAVKPCRVLKLKFSALNEFIAGDPDLAARIQAAVNDSLCLKIIQLTHGSLDG
ncbi:MAG: cyclic nucleotide-binding domain-containing protein [Candidatus Cloacimonas sp.]|nr:cyclic nucleotide-binding domain-containing protein [Candidatus Cloacimonas sp.]HNX02117.1 cyclic nucleotide-binding domain-containing protein [Candidatus Cloacimonas sp.]HPS59782.1 cyclic nucleotide-binding domain-containing protein [Candidatus Cloacimonas sp.]